MSPALQSFCAWVTLMVAFVVITAPVLPRGTMTAVRSVAVLAFLAALATAPAAATLYMYLARFGSFP